MVVPPSDAWNSGLTLDWFGLKRASPLPRIVRFKDAGACTRVKEFQPETTVMSVFNICAACAEHCCGNQEPELVRSEGNVSFFECQCEIVNGTSLAPRKNNNRV